MLSNTVKMNSVITYAIRLSLIPFSLRDKVIHWFHPMPSGIHSHMEPASWRVLGQIFPSTVIAERETLMRLGKVTRSPYFKAWDRFKVLLRRCICRVLTQYPNSTPSIMDLAMFLKRLWMQQLEEQWLEDFSTIPRANWATC